MGDNSSVKVEGHYNDPSASSSQKKKAISNVIVYNCWVEEMQAVAQNMYSYVNICSLAFYLSDCCYD